MVYLIVCIGSLDNIFNPYLCNGIINRLNKEETQELASLLCKKLALDLDNNDLSLVELTFLLLEEFPLDIAFVAIKSQIGINRIIQHNLDRHPKSVNLLDKLTKAFDKRTPKMKGLEKELKIVYPKLHFNVVGDNRIIYFSNDKNTNLPKVFNGAKIEKYWSIPNTDLIVSLDDGIYRLFV